MLPDIWQSGEETSYLVTVIPSAKGLYERLALVIPFSKILL